MTEKIVSRAEWLEQRKALLVKEKALMREQEALAAERRALPLVAIDRDYRFQTTGGEKSLADLFGGCGQLIVQHFMFGPDWEAGCPSCSFWADNFNGIDCHLEARNTRFVVVSNAPLETLNRYKARMGWDFEWVSAGGSSFSADFGVSFHNGDETEYQQGYNYTGEAHMTELPGISAFTRLDDGRVAHSYSTYARGLDALNSACHLLDLTHAGRDEAELPFSMAWVKRHDEYATS